MINCMIDVAMLLDIYGNEPHSHMFPSSDFNGYQLPPMMWSCTTTVPLNWWSTVAKWQWLKKSRGCVEWVVRLEGICCVSWRERRKACPCGPFCLFQVDATLGYEL